MDLIKIYECLCDRTRLRILNLLNAGPLCVCHIQEILEEPQVKVSRHLGYLRKREMVMVERDANMMIYSLPNERPRELELNLACLQDRAREDNLIKKDTIKMKAIRKRIGCETVQGASASCCTTNKTKK